MNRLVARSMGEVRPDLLPGPQRGGRARVLFLTIDIMGFRTLAEHLEWATQSRDDIEAVHVRLQLPTWAKVLGKAVPKLSKSGWDFCSYRHMLLWRNVLRRLFRTRLPLERFDVVHITTQGNGLVGADFVGPGSPKFVVQIDATGLGEAAEFGFSRTARAPFVAAEKRMFDAAACVACWSRWAADSVRRDYGVPSERVCVAKPAIRIPEIAREHASHEGRVRLAIVGNNWVRKGGDRLLRWHQQRWKDRAELHVFGANIEPVAGAANVTWHGHTARETLLKRILPTMDVMVIPTRQDTLLLAALEASACGLPVVSTRQAGLPDVVVEGETGFLCASNDESAYVGAVERLMGDPALRRRMGESGRTFVASEWDPARCYGEQLDRLCAIAMTH